MFTTHQQGVNAAFFLACFNHFLGHYEMREGYMQNVAIYFNPDSFFPNDQW